VSGQIAELSFGSTLRVKDCELIGGSFLTAEKQFQVIFNIYSGSILDLADDVEMKLYLYDYSDEAAFETETPERTLDTIKEIYELHPGLNSTDCPGTFTPGGENCHFTFPFMVFQSSVYLTKTELATA